MSMQIRNCVTLREYRDQVLGLNQSDIATAALCDQSWVSAVENGKPPRRSSRTWDALLRAYGLMGQEDQFMRMIQNAARLKALRKTLAEDFPLQLFAVQSDTGLVIDLNSAAQIARSA